MREQLQNRKNNNSKIIISYDFYHLRVIMKLLHSTVYVQSLTPTSRDIYGNKRSLTGYNVYLRYFFLNFKLLTDDKQRELLCDTGIYTEETYILSDEDSVDITKHSYCIFF